MPGTEFTGRVGVRGFGCKWYGGWCGGRGVCEDTSTGARDVVYGITGDGVAGPPYVGVSCLMGLAPFV